MLFNGIAVLMLLAAAAGVYVALGYGARKRPTRLMDTAAEELVRLEEDREAGLIDTDAFEAAKRDLEAHRYTEEDPGGKHARAGRAFPAVAAMVPVLGALLLYAALGRPDLARTPNTPADAAQAESRRPDDPRRMVERLAERMEQNPGDIRGWKMLGRSYVVLGEYGKARRAYAKAAELSDGRDTELQVAYAEAMVLEDVSALDGRAGRIFDKALKTDPDNPRALWYGGLAAAREGRTEQAAGRWRRLLAQNPPERLRDVVEERLAALGEQSPAAQAPAASGEGVTVRVSLAVEPGNALSSDTPVFVFVRPEGVEGGPPLAVKRIRVGDLPVTVRLRDADAMVEGTTLSSHERVRVVARVARSGGVQAQSGDLEGSATAPVAADGEAVSLAIDRVIP